jgi:hypothetical protein
MTMHSLFVNVSFGFLGTDSRVYGGKVFLWIFPWQSNSYVHLYVTSTLYPVPMRVDACRFLRTKVSRLRYLLHWSHRPKSSSTGTCLEVGNF